MLNFRPTPGGGGLNEEQLRIIFEALVETQRLILECRSRRETRVTKRTIDPYALAAHQGQWYLVGYCHLQRDVRTFRCARIVALRKAPQSRGEGPQFEVSPDFRLSDYVGLERWRLPRGEKMQVEARFSPRVAWRVKRRWADEGQWSETTEGGHLTVEVLDAEAFLQVTLQFGADAVILRPPALRDRARQSLRRTAEVHLE